MRNEMTKTGTFKGLWLCYTIGALAGLTAIGIVGPVGKEVMTNAGMSAADSTALVFQLILPFAIVNGLGRPIFGTLTDKLTPKKCGNAYICAHNSGMLANVHELFLNHCIHSRFAILWGCLGAWLAIAPTATASYFGMKDNAKNYGLVFTAYGVGAVVGGYSGSDRSDYQGRSWVHSWMLIGRFSWL